MTFAQSWYAIRRWTDLPATLIFRAALALIAIGCATFLTLGFLLWLISDSRGGPLENIFSALIVMSTFPFVIACSFQCVMTIGNISRVRDVLARIDDIAIKRASPVIVASTLVALAIWLAQLQ